MNLGIIISILEKLNNHIWNLKSKVNYLVYQLKWITEETNFKNKVC